MLEATDAKNIAGLTSWHMNMSFWLCPLKQLQETGCVLMGLKNWHKREKLVRGKGWLLALSVHVGICLQQHTGEGGQMS